MAHKISRSTAEQIVDAIKNLCDYNVNYIDSDGIIYASTDKNRIGTFHQAAVQVFHSGETLEVHKPDLYVGTQPGVNIPIIYQDELLAVVGITGRPDEVRKYGYLAQKITYLLLREQELDAQRQTEHNRLGYVLSALIAGGQRLSDRLVAAYLCEQKLNTGEYRIVLIKTPKSQSDESLYRYEREIFQTFRQAQGLLYAFKFPDEYRLLIRNADYVQYRSLFCKLLQREDLSLKAGVGLAHAITEQAGSYQEAKLALAVLNAQGEGAQQAAADLSSNFREFESLKLDALYVGLGAEQAQYFIEHTLGTLTEQELKVLNCYYEHEMALGRTAAALFMHKNTLQYQLERIFAKSGLNPRSFKDACCLYTALLLRRQESFRGLSESKVQ